MKDTNKKLHKNEKATLFRIILILLILSTPFFVIKLSEAHTIEPVRDYIIDDLIGNNKSISFYKNKISLGKGESEVVIVGFKNKKDSTLKYKLSFVPISLPVGTPFSIDEFFRLPYIMEDSLAANDIRINVIRVIIPVSVQDGLYLMTFNVIDVDTNKTYAKADINISIDKKMVDISIENEIIREKDINIFQKIWRWFLSLFKK